MTGAGPEPALRSFLSATFPSGWPDGPLGVAVSGGSDSTALLHLLAGIAAGRPLRVATVDHGLRPAAAAEAAAVADACAALGLPHRTLHWDGAAARAQGGNLADLARRGRLAALAGWAGAEGIAAIALGHTRDDQAETVLMRLERGSGVDGLAAMAACRRAGGRLWLRPLLRCSRQDLRDWLTARGLGWSDDPGNDDPRAGRTRARRAIAALGLDTGRLAETAALMAAAREVLDDRAADLARRSLRAEAGDLLIGLPAFAAAPAETRGRLLSAALRRVGGGEYRPRLRALRALEAAILAGGRRTLAGCIVGSSGGTVRIGREPAAALAAPAAAPGAPWDRRFRIDAPPALAEGAEVRALGAAGLLLCPDWRARGLPRASQCAGPALWRDGRLLAAPLAGQGAPVGLSCLADAQEFVAFLIAH